MKDRRAWFGLVTVTTCCMLAFTSGVASAYPRPGSITRVSVSSSGEQASYPSDDPCNAGPGQSDITPDGRFVAFVSGADNLVSNDGSRGCDVFVYDRLRKKTERVSISSTGEEGMSINAGEVPELRSLSSHPTISANGRFVAFESSASNLVSPVSDPPVTDGNLERDVFVHDRKTGKTQLVSVAYDPTGKVARSGIRGGLDPSISLNGRYVAFGSPSFDLVEEDANPLGHDIFVRDLKKGETKLISALPGSLVDEIQQAIDNQNLDLVAQLAAKGSSFTPSISGDGRFVEFVSSARLLPEDMNINDDVYVYDMEKERFELISVGIDGRSSDPTVRPGEATFEGVPRSISADGRFVLFSHFWSNLVPNDNNGAVDSIVHNGLDVFVRDRHTGRTERISTSSTGTEGTSISFANSISADGRYVALTSRAPEFADEKSPLTTGGVSDADVFVYDRMTGEQRIVSVRADGSESGCPGTDHGNAVNGAVANGGRWVTFYSCSHDFVDGDTNDAMDVFVRYMGPEVGAGYMKDALGRITLGGAPVFVKSGFLSVRDREADTAASALATASAHVDLIGARVAVRPSLHDLYAVVDVAALPPVLPGVPHAPLYGFRIVVAGTTYELRAQRTLNGALGNTDAQFGLFRCEEALCDLVTELNGGYGTVGRSLVVSVPLNALGLADGGSLDSITAFTALGTYMGGSASVLDSIELR